MKEKIDQLREEFELDLKQSQSTKQLENLKIKYLGRKGPVQALMPNLKNCSQEERPLFGKLINELKVAIEESIEASFGKYKQQERVATLEKEGIDTTLPGRKKLSGYQHPISQTIDKCLDILKDMGFSVVTSPEIESEYYNYGGLNYAEDHPARDMQDTFYLSEDVLLRSHTTSIQQRVMEAEEPPIRVVSYGKCYRNETVTSRSHVMFHQIDPLYIDKGVTFADLIATKKEFYSRFFNQEVEIRVRPSYFPFVEPGMEIDIFCIGCKGTGCKLCKNTGWLEVCGAGMVHPEVLKEGGLDPEVYSGYAWGGGIERLFMLERGVSDIRQFTENDMRFLSQFS